jgi:hypothetical protein
MRRPLKLLALLTLIVMIVVSFGSSRSDHVSIAKSQRVPLILVTHKISTVQRCSIEAICRLNLRALVYSLDLETCATFACAICTKLDYTQIFTGHLSNYQSKSEEYRLMAARYVLLYTNGGIYADNVILTSHLFSKSGNVVDKNLLVLERNSSFAKHAIARLAHFEDIDSRFFLDVKSACNWDQKCKIRALSDTKILYYYTKSELEAPPDMEAYDQFVTNSFGIVIESPFKKPKGSLLQMIMARHCSNTEMSM